MKRLIHTPGLILIALCGLTCSLIGLERVEYWLADQYEALDKECR